MRLTVRAFLLVGAFVGSNAYALECGQFDFPFCRNAADQPAQYAGGFNPGTGFGGFGGGDCKDKIKRTPVVFVHGNGDSAIGWDSPGPARAGRQAQPSVYDDLKAHGYNDCELFGITYLDRNEQELGHTGRNFHQLKKYAILWQLIRAVKDYTGSSKVDVVAHSLGVSMTLAALDYYADHGEDSWGSVRRFINIAGGIRGLNSCVVGIVAAKTCRAEHSGANGAFYEFGFFPDGAFPWLSNRWTSAAGDHSLRLAPQRRPDVAFYTVHSGAQDDIHCPRVPTLWPSALDCRHGPLFGASPNVRAQIDIGADAPSSPPIWASKVSSGAAERFPRDLGGIGHFGARDYSGPIVRRMLTTECQGNACAADYEGEAKLSGP